MLPSRVFLLVTDAVYYLLCLLLAPVLIYKVLGREKYRRHFPERFGGVPRPLGPTTATNGRPVIWVHAVSLGEVRAAEPIVAALEKRLPKAEIVVSATTMTGREAAKTAFPGRLTFQFPLDFSWAVGRALRRIKPSAVVLIELEVWPNFVRQCELRHIPVVVANGRMTATSAGSYARARPVLGFMFRALRLALVQTQSYAERFAKVGVNPNHIHVVGTVKYDGVSLDPAQTATHRAEWRRRLGAADDEFVFVAGSTHPPEHETIVATWRTLRAEGVSVRLVLVPRHPEKPDPVRFFERENIPFVRQSQLATNASGNTTAVPADAVVFGDVVGTLAKLYAAADVAFVGKSLIADGGGQNPLEPAAMGVPTVVGPSMENFAEPMEDLLARRAVRQIASADELTAAVRGILSDVTVRDNLGNAAREAVREGKGAADRTAALIARTLFPDAPTPTTP